MKFKREKLKGLTLIETLVYLALFGVLFTTLATFVSLMVQSNSLSNERIAIQKNSIFLNEHFKQTFTESVSIDNANTVYNSNTGKVVLINGANTSTYEILSNKINIDKNGTDNFLMIPTYKVDIFYIEQVLDAKGNTIGAKINLEISSVKNPETKSNIKSLYLF